jgi:hypothetical protein
LLLLLCSLPGVLRLLLSTAGWATARRTTGRRRRRRRRSREEEYVGCSLLVLAVCSLLEQKTHAVGRPTDGREEDLGSSLQLLTSYRSAVAPLSGSILTTNPIYSGTAASR